MKKIYGILCFLILSILRFGHVAAVTVNPPTENLPSINKRPSGEAIASIITYGIGLTGVLALIAITWGGITMIYGAGDDEKFKKGKKIIIFALVGVFLAGAAYVIVNLVANVDIAGNAQS